MSAPTHAERHDSPTLTPFDPDKLEVAPGIQHQGLQGWVPELASENEICEALEKAFDYRGDVTLTLKDGSKVEGYVFDRVAGTSLATSFVRLIPKDSTQRLKISYTEIAALAFTGRDTAAGKSWEAWLRKYWESKAKGEKNPGNQPESLE